MQHLISQCMRGEAVKGNLKNYWLSGTMHTYSVVQSNCISVGQGQARAGVQE